LNAIPTGEFFHAYLDPERGIPEEAFRVHGLSAEFLADKPVFAKVVADFLKFTGSAKIVAHNAEFDMRFLNAELALLGIEPIASDRVIDTLTLARRKFPGVANSLDALCARYGIDTSRRTKHGALLDAGILAEVYAELTGGRQAALVFAPGADSIGAGAASLLAQRPHPLPGRLNVEELFRHHAFTATLGAAPVWDAYLPTQVPAGTGETIPA
jgi:DNA polymerase-3 subunit epsilon